jgi:copper resistance protein C
LISYLVSNLSMEKVGSNMLDGHQAKISRAGIRSSTGKSSLFFVAAIVILSTVALLAPNRAFAHAVLVTSHPAANSTVSGPDVAILLKYNSRVDPANSTLSLLAPDGKIEKVAIGRQPAPNDLSANVTGLRAGAYVLRWQALSSDGHITRGEFAFHIR